MRDQLDSRADFLAAAETVSNKSGLFTHKLEAQTSNYLGRRNKGNSKYHTLPGNEDAGEK